MMKIIENNHRVSMLKGILMMRCPQCRKSPLYIDPNPYHWKSMGAMYQTCPTCGRTADTEAGYYFGAMYFSYALMVAWNLSITIAIWIITGSVFDHFKLLMFTGIISTILISPLMFRFSRVLWIYMFFKILKK